MWLAGCSHDVSLGTVMSCDDKSVLCKVPLGVGCYSVHYW